ncbi:penicillin acylase family protein [Streptomyces acidiscabies]|uniref:penicillin acylase family protein n=1 Tax=Streptomyces acidiscabies TaxID=42234 RepID=UPI00099DCBC1|nr:penicillin acylase family protein [Streptomyces acidiscabies]
MTTYRDAFGVPHLRETTATALAHAQGLMTARDRAWQLEVERHRAEGTSAAFLGAEALAWDTFARRARLTDTARRCFERLEGRDPETAGWVRAYVEGVNEGLGVGGAEAGGVGRDDFGQDRVGRGGDERGGEGRTGVGRGGSAGEAVPGGPFAVSAPSTSSAPGPASLVAQSPYPTPEFERAGLTPAPWSPWTPLAIWLSVHILFAGFPAKLWREEAIRHLGPDAVPLFATDGPATSGSNGWLLDRSRTVSGNALIAGDPHRFIEEPGIYQQVRLACDEFDVVGLAVPGVPGIAHFGHTGTVAWAITNAMADYQDLYQERLRRTGAGVEALDPDGVWRRVHRHTELIEVADEPPVEIEVLETPRGPVIAGGPEGLDDATPLALSLRYPPRVTGELGFGTFLKLLRARDVDDVDAALDTWCEPVNVVQAADTAGGTLHRVTGRVPTRAEANRVRLVPAWEPGHEWTGWQEMPRAELADGIAVMANQRGPARELGVEFAPTHRADRIRTLLQEREKWTPEEIGTIHMDTRLASAGPLLDRVAALRNLTPEAETLRNRLLRWNRRMDATSTDAASYAALRSEVVRTLAAHPAFAALTTPPAYPDVLLPWLALTPRIGFALEHLLRAEELYGIDRDTAVREALETVATRPPAQWGDTHRLTPWRALPDDTYDPPPLSGDHDCVLCTTAIPGVTDRAARGPVARYVWDLADRRRSRWIVPHGAQLPLWLKGDMAPVETDWNRLHKEHDVRP